MRCPGLRLNKECADFRPDEDVWYGPCTYPPNRLHDAFRTYIDWEIALVKDAERDGATGIRLATSPWSWRVKRHGARHAVRQVPILVGTSSWTDHRSSIAACLPTECEDARGPASLLRVPVPPLVEIDSSYYGIRSVDNAQRWVERTPEQLVFNIKTYRLFPRHQTPIVSVPRDMQKALGPRTKKNAYDHEMPEELSLELRDQFRSLLVILRDAGKLGAVHMQFAPWVAFHPETFVYIEHCRAMLTGFTVAVEFRNRTWFANEKRTTRTLNFERDNGFVNVVVDARGDIPNTIPSVWEVTNPALSVGRLHGRNHATWNLKGVKASSQRFDYDYSDDELCEIAAHVKVTANKSQTTHVLFNNNYQDQGQRGANALARMLAVQAQAWRSPVPRAKLPRRSPGLVFTAALRSRFRTLGLVFLICRTMGLQQRRLTPKQRRTGDNRASCSGSPNQLIQQRRHGNVHCRIHSVGHWYRAVCKTIDRTGVERLVKHSRLSSGVVQYV